MGEILFLYTNPFFDTREFEIEFTDGTRDEYTANLIAENMYVQVDDKGHQFQLHAEIQVHWKDGMAISKEERKIRSTNGTERDNIITRGWEVMVMWKDGSTYWIQLKYINDSHLLEVAQYEVTNRI